MRFREQSVSAETPVDHTVMEDVSEQEMVLYAVIVTTAGLADAIQIVMDYSFVEVAGSITMTSCLRELLRC